MSSRTYYTQCANSLSSHSRSLSVDRGFKSSARQSRFDTYRSPSSLLSPNSIRLAARAASVGPTCTCTWDRPSSMQPQYYGYMPFNRRLNELENKIRDRMNATTMSAVASVRQPSVTTYRDAFSRPSRYDTYQRDKVWEYANHLDNEETIRDYMHSTSSRRGESPYYASSNLRSQREQMNRDLLANFRHYARSNATLSHRNSRAHSPLINREIERYYNTASRTHFVGDISAGHGRDFRHYNYRPVPYFGSSDHYAYIPRIISRWNNVVYPENVPPY